jgi:hypothetical protein
MKVCEELIKKVAQVALPEHDETIKALVLYRLHPAHDGFLQGCAVGDVAGQSDGVPSPMKDLEGGLEQVEAVGP